MKNIQNLLILILSVAVVYLFLSNKYRVERLDARIVSLETTLTKAKDDCETRIAYLKVEKNIQGHDKTAINNTELLAGLINRAEANTRKIRNDNLKKMGIELGLTESQQKQAALIIDEMEKEKNNIPNKAAAEKIFVFDAGYTEMINKVNNSALAKFKNLLTNQQYKLMIAKGYDQKFGLKAIQPLVPAKQ